MSRISWIDSFLLSTRIGRSLTIQLNVPAYALWRLNWIHPFVEGNGRTARAACYYLLCMKQGRLLPGKKVVPERIRENRGPYYGALEAADAAWDEGNLDVSEMAEYLEGLLKGQLTEP
jgi:Fic family protein